MARWVTPAPAIWSSVRCRSTGSGVVSEPYTAASGVTSPIVPMLAALWPSADQICRVNAATEVLPLVPVTAAIVPGWREKNLAAARPSARRTLGTCTSATPSGTAIARSAHTAPAPAARACGERRRNEGRTVLPGARHGDEQEARFHGTAVDGQSRDRERVEARLAAALLAQEIAQPHGSLGSLPGLTRAGSV